MGTIGIGALLAAFGVVCAFYVSVVGFALSAVAVVVLLTLLNLCVGGRFSAGLFVGGLVVMEVGYFVGIVACALIGHARPLPAKEARSLEGDLLKHD
jgi:hypothetical protein